MGLLKKTDIIGKIYILIILFIVIIATITVITRYANKNADREANNENVENVIEEESNNVAIESDVGSEIVENETVVETITSEVATNKPNQANQNNKSNNNTKNTSVSTIAPVSTGNTNSSNNNKVETTNTPNNVEIVQQTNQTPTPTVEQPSNEVKIDFSKYDRYQKALNGGYTAFKRNDAEIAKLEGLIREAINEFGYTNVNLQVDSSITNLRYFTANKTNVENLVYNSEYFTIHYYAETEYTIAPDGTESILQIRSYGRAK